MWWKVDSRVDQNGHPVRVIGSIREWKTNGDWSKGNIFWFLKKILMSSLVDTTQARKEEEPGTNKTRTERK